MSETTREARYEAAWQAVKQLSADDRSMVLMVALGWTGTATTPELQDGLRAIEAGIDEARRPARSA